MDILQSLPVLLIAILLHEACGHKFFAETFTSLKPTMIAIGVPIVKATEAKTYNTKLGTIKLPSFKVNTIWKKIERKGKIPIILSWLLIGGGVGFEDKEYYSVGKLGEKVLMILAGPLVNFLAAFLVILAFSDLVTAWEILKSNSLVTAELLVALVSTTTVPEALSRHGFYESTLLLANQTLYWQMLAYFALWNISLAVTNLLPVPGLDGGQIVSTFLINIFGERIIPSVKKVNTVFAYVLILVSTVAVVWWIIASFVNLIKTLV